MSVELLLALGIGAALGVLLAGIVFWLWPLALYLAARPYLQPIMYLIGTLPLWAGFGLWAACAPGPVTPGTAWLALTLLWVLACLGLILGYLGRWLHDHYFPAAPPAPARAPRLAEYTAVARASAHHATTHPDEEAPHVR